MHLLYRVSLGKRCSAGSDSLLYKSAGRIIQRVDFRYACARDRKSNIGLLGYDSFVQVFLIFFQREIHPTLFDLALRQIDLPTVFQQIAISIVVDRLSIDLQEEIALCRDRLGLLMPEVSLMRTQTLM